jgi:hypothetical protein
MDKLGSTFIPALPTGGSMKDSSSVLDADMSYALRMVRGGFNTPEQAAQICGVSLLVLQGHLSTADSSEADRVKVRVH